MPLFIALSLALAFMVETGNSLLSFLEAPSLIYICLPIAIISIIVSMFRKLRGIVWYDIFSSTALLVWFSYWKSIFKDDSPIFFFYPLYFALITAFVSLFFIGQRHRIDDDSFRFMQSRAKNSLFQAWVLMIGVLASLELQQHFMLYPVMMTLLILRFTLTNCLEGRERSKSLS